MAMLNIIMTGCFLPWDDATEFREGFSTAIERCPLTRHGWLGCGGYISLLFSPFSLRDQLPKVWLSNWLALLHVVSKALCSNPHTPRPRRSQVLRPTQNMPPSQRYVLSTSYVVGTVLDLVYKSMTKTGKTTAFIEHPGQGRQNELNIWNVGLW